MTHALSGAVATPSSSVELKAVRAVERLLELRGELERVATNPNSRPGRIGDITRESDEIFVREIRPAMRAGTLGKAYTARAIWALRDLGELESLHRAKFGARVVA